MPRQTDLARARVRRACGSARAVQRSLFEPKLPRGGRPDKIGGCRLHPILTSAKRRLAQDHAAVLRPQADHRVGHARGAAVGVAGVAWATGRARSLVLHRSGPRDRRALEPRASTAAGVAIVRQEDQIVVAKRAGRWTRSATTRSGADSARRTAGSGQSRRSVASSIRMGNGNGSQKGPNTAAHTARPLVILDAGWWPRQWRIPRKPATRMGQGMGTG